LRKQLHRSLCACFRALNMNSNLTTMAYVNCSSYFTHVCCQVVEPSAYFWKLLSRFQDLYPKTERCNIDFKGLGSTAFSVKPKA
ncbi:MAG: hypothetical protein V3U88_10000, partial [Methylococcales bacterium]